MRRVNTLRGLLYYDFLALKTTFIMLGFFNLVAVFVVIYYFDKGAASGSAAFVGVAAYLSALTMSCGASVIADRTTKWHEYALSTPAKASEYVKVKYIINFSWLVVQSLVLWLFYVIADRQYAFNFDASVVLFFAIYMILFFSVGFPFLLREKYKLSYMIVFVLMIVSGCVFVTGFVIPADADSFNPNLAFANMLLGVNAPVWLVVSAAVIGSVFVSYKAACKNLRKLMI